MLHTVLGDCAERKQREPDSLGATESQMLEGFEDLAEMLEQ